MVILVEMRKHLNLLLGIFPHWNLEIGGLLFITTYHDLSHFRDPSFKNKQNISFKILTIV